MKIYISVDIEGIAGVVTPQEGDPGNTEYEQARRLMTMEANAAIAGAFEGGASEVLVNDSHGPMVNLLPEVLDQRAELIRGNIKPFSMFAGLDGTFNGVMCVGYHAAAGDFGVLAHTNSYVFTAIRLNGKMASEAMFYGAYAGSLGVPVILLSGDDVIERSCAGLFEGARLIRVKTALGQRAARSLAPSAACALIRSGAADAVRACDSIQPYRIAEPCRVEFEFSSQVFADVCARVPVASRLDARTIAFDCPTIKDAVGWMNICSGLTARLR
jgi:D-amino peptidase